MPVPTTVHFWSGESDILNSHTAAGWNAKSNGDRIQKSVDMKRVKAEMGFSAADYYSLVFENLATKSAINGGDLSGSELEAAETEIVRNSIAESIRATMWVGSTSRTSGHNTFNGFLTKIYSAVTGGDITPKSFDSDDIADAEYALTLFDTLWGAADARITDAKGDGQLAFFVSSDIYNLYEKALDEAGVDASYTDRINGRAGLMYHGIPVIDLGISSYIYTDNAYAKSMAFLTDRRNLVMVVNTADFPGTEIRMWYNPDEMENRQRATFAVGCEILDETLITLALKS